MVIQTSRRIPLFIEIDVEDVKGLVCTVNSITSNNEIHVTMNRVFGRKKAPGPPPPSLSEASAGVGTNIEGLDG